VGLPESPVHQHRRSCRLTALAVLLALPAAVPGLLTAANPELDRADAESRLAEVLTEIERLREQLDSARLEHRDGQQQLRTLDLEVQSANLELRSLQAQRREHEQELAEMKRRRASFLASLDQRLDELAHQVRASYRDGRQSRMKLVLNQDDPALLSRLLAYYEFISRAQAERIGLLRDTLETLGQMQESIDRGLAHIARLTEHQRDLLERLGEKRARRQALLAELAGEITGDESRLQELERNRRDLESLIERLADVLADIPADLGSHLGVAQQKGRLPMPVRGPVRAAYGQSRSRDTLWQGWLIGADPGAEVRAIAYGRIAFADWLRGYGLLMIIDHGQGYMSLYGHNESLLHEAGAWVEPGDAISLVGSNPGNDQGLYFELRNRGKTLDPAGWLKR
jgi:septal ring factor EnvC (AmiA/AmiB activator)